MPFAILSPDTTLLGLKPGLVLGALRGAEAPLFHGAAGVYGVVSAYGAA